MLNVATCARRRIAHTMPVMGAWFPILGQAKRPLDAPAGAAIGVPGKTERCGSNSTCVLLDSAKKACLRQACTLQGRRRGGLTARTAHKEEQGRLAPRARCGRGMARSPKG
jgi:hypothetical protein